jgi:hypothetical protein
MTSVGPITVQVAPAKAAEDGKPSVSGIYRNKAAVEALTETFNGCGTLYELFNKTVEHCSSNRCLGWRPVGDDGSAGPYQFITYKETQDKARQLAAALSKAGFKPKDKLGIYSVNKVEWMLAIRALDVLSGTIVPIYDSLGESAVEYIVKHSGGLVVRGAAVGCINAGHRGGWGGGGVPGWVEGLLALQCIHSPAVATWHTGGATGPRGPSPHPCSPYRWLISSLSLPAPLPPPRDALGPGGHCQPGQVCQGGRRREGLCEEE